MATPENFEYVTLDNNTEYIKIHGLQRTGTNWLSHLINENLENSKALVNLGGWKHGHYHAPWMLGREVHVVAIAKNPYSWLISMYNYWGPDKKLRIGPDLAGVSFEQFVRNRVIVERQRDVPFLFRASNPVQYWNNMNFHWSSLRLNTKGLCFVTYEKLLKNTEGSLTDISESLGIKLKPREIEKSDVTFVPSGENIKPSKEKFSKKDYYTSGGYMDQYTPDLLRFVNEELDLDLMVSFGYELAIPGKSER